MKTDPNLKTVEVLQSSHILRLGEDDTLLVVPHVELDPSEMALLQAELKACVKSSFMILPPLTNLTILRNVSSK